MWEFWRRHKRKVYVTLGVLGSGFLLYKLYDARKHRLTDLQKQLVCERETDELIKTQIQVHFARVQEIADSTTLPHVMHLLSSRLEESLDLRHLTTRLMQGKGQSSNLSAPEKIELWERLKILSFTKMMSSLWAMTILCLYIRVQVNILGRHLYIDTARDLGSSYMLDEIELIDRNDEQKFLSCADYLSSYGLNALISDTEAAVSEVLKGKKLKDFFNVSILNETIIQILDTFMSMSSPHHWVGYLMPVGAGASRLTVPSNGGSDISHVSKFGLLMAETRAVLSSSEFGNTVEISLRTMAMMLLEDVISECGENNLMSGMPLAKVLPRIARIGQLLLEEHNRNKYIQHLQSISEVNHFFTLLYSSSPSS